MVDARLPDGSRVNAIIPPLALRGPTVTIRKFSRDPYTMNDLITFGTVTARSAQFIAACVKGKLNILISGGTGTGKTTTLNAMSAFIPASERIVTIEDAAELQLQQDHVVTLESRPANIEGMGEIKIRELVRNALRMRPDRIIVGEVRGAETLDMLQAMNTGHEGSLTTIHANTPRDALARLETLVLTAGVELPHRAIREQIASAFDLLVQIERLVDGSRRVTAISEVLGMEADIITLQDVFIASPPTKARPTRSLTGCSRRCAPPVSSLTSSRRWRPTTSSCRRRSSRRTTPTRSGPRSRQPASAVASNEACARSALAAPRCDPPHVGRAAGSRIQAVDASGFPSVRVTYVAPVGAPAPQLRESGRRGRQLTGRQPRQDEEHRRRDRPFTVDARQAARERDRGGRTVRGERRPRRSRRRRRVRQLGHRAHPARRKPGGGTRPDRRPPRRPQVGHRAVRRDRPLRRPARAGSPARARDRRRHRRRRRLEHALAGRGSRGRAAGARVGLHDRHRRAGLHLRGAAAALGRDRRLVPPGLVVAPARPDVREPARRALPHLAAHVSHVRRARAPHQPDRDRPRRRLALGGDAARLDRRHRHGRDRPDPVGGLHRRRHDVPRADRRHALPARGRILVRRTARQSAAAPHRAARLGRRRRAAALGARRPARRPAHGSSTRSRPPSPTSSSSSASSA